MPPLCMTTCLSRLSISTSPLRSSKAPLRQQLPPSISAHRKVTSPRQFSTTTQRNGTWLLPTEGQKKRDRKGRPRVPTGGSARGTTIQYGDYGLRMSDHHRRISAQQLKNGAEAIKVRLRGLKYKLYTRVAAQIGVYKKGNEVRMGKGKGSFDHWAARVAVSKIIFELRGEVHEQVARDALRLAGNKMPGQYEFVHKNAPPVVGITKLGNGITLEQLKRPRRAIPLGSQPSPIPNAAGPALAGAPTPIVSTEAAAPVV